MRGSVKVDKDLLVAKLEAKLAELKKTKTKRDIASDKHKKAVAAWEKKVADILLRKGVVDSFYLRYDKTAQLSYKQLPELPDAPELKDFTNGEEPYSWGMDSDIANIEEFLKVMSITADDKVSMAVVNNLSKYL